MKTTYFQFLFSVIAAFAVLGSVALAEQPAAPAAPEPAAEQMAPSDKMDRMAITVTRMAEMCEMMMKKEQAAMPYLLAVGIITAALFFTALVLLIVLQLQWIKFWSWKLRNLRAPENAVALNNQSTRNK